MVDYVSYRSNILKDISLKKRSVYKDVEKNPEEIYTAFGLTRATFYRYAKILDTHTYEEIRKMTVGIIFSVKYGGVSIKIISWGFPCRFFVPV